jgi:hypothetical protein
VRNQHGTGPDLIGHFKLDGFTPASVVTRTWLTFGKSHRFRI